MNMSRYTYTLNREQKTLRHVHVDGILEGAGVDLQGIFHLAAQLGNVLLDGAFHLLADPDRKSVV